MRLLIVSDTHGKHREIDMPDGDVFIHAGDMSMKGRMSEISAVGEWLQALPHRHKIVVAGNHDFAFELSRGLAAKALGEGVTYLEDSGVTIEGIRFWGSPWQPWFYDWAFNLYPGPALAQKWALIPPSTDVLITHGPPRNILDEVGKGEHAGCVDLAARLDDLSVRVHAFGHIHESSGLLEQDGRVYVNASICDGSYNATNPARVVDI